MAKTKPKEPITTTEVDDGKPKNPPTKPPGK